VTSLQVAGVAGKLGSDEDGNTGWTARAPGGSRENAFGRCKFARSHRRSTGRPIARRPLLKRGARAGRKNHPRWRPRHSRASPAPR
jgi:hypothetical protein